MRGTQSFWKYPNDIFKLLLYLPRRPEEVLACRLKYALVDLVLSLISWGCRSLMRGLQRRDRSYPIIDFIIRETVLYNETLLLVWMLNHCEEYLYELSKHYPLLRVSAYICCGEEFGDSVPWCACSVGTVRSTGFILLLPYRGTASLLRYLLLMLNNFFPSFHRSLGSWLVRKVRGSAAEEPPATCISFLPRDRA